MCKYKIDTMTHQPKTNVYLFTSRTDMPVAHMPYDSKQNSGNGTHASSICCTATRTRLQLEHLSRTFGICNANLIISLSYPSYCSSCISQSVKKVTNLLNGMDFLVNVIVIAFEGLVRKARTKIRYTRIPLVAPIAPLPSVSVSTYL